MGKTDDLHLEDMESQELSLQAALKEEAVSNLCQTEGGCCQQDRRGEEPHLATGIAGEQGNLPLVEGADGREQTGLALSVVTTGDTEVVASQGLPQDSEQGPERCRMLPGLTWAVDVLGPAEVCTTTTTDAV